mmetsp:Transcript_5315/g.18620  ORF Transcript_5315/g.18620 Transcript_5315/m.18620 type:complete len:222 (-) Transcript_5315:269-934(-)
MIAPLGLILPSEPLHLVLQLPDPIHGPAQLLGAPRGLGLALLGLRLGPLPGGPPLSRLGQLARNILLLGSQGLELLRPGSHGRATLPRGLVAPLLPDDRHGVRRDWVGGDPSVLLAHHVLGPGSRELDLLGALRPVQRVGRLPEGQGRRGDGGDHGGLALPAQRVLEHLGQLGVPERDMLLSLHQGADAAGQGQEGLVDVRALHAPRRGLLLVRDGPLGPG